MLLQAINAGFNDQMTAKLQEHAPDLELTPDNWRQVVDIIADDKRQIIISTFQGVKPRITEMTGNFMTWLHRQESVLLVLTFSGKPVIILANLDNACAAHSIQCQMTVAYLAGVMQLLNTIEAVTSTTESACVLQQCQCLE